MQYSHAMGSLVLEHMIGNMTCFTEKRGKVGRLLICVVCIALKVGVFGHVSMWS